MSKVVVMSYITICWDKFEWCVSWFVLMGATVFVEQRLVCGQVMRFVKESFIAWTSIRAHVLVSNHVTNIIEDTTLDHLFHCFICELVFA